MACLKSKAKRTQRGRRHAGLHGLLGREGARLGPVRGAGGTGSGCAPVLPSGTVSAPLQDGWAEPGLPCPRLWGCWCLGGGRRQGSGAVRVPRRRGRAGEGERHGKQGAGGRMQGGAVKEPSSSSILSTRLSWSSRIARAQACAAEVQSTSPLSSAPWAGVSRPQNPSAFCSQFWIGFMGVLTQ